MMCQPVDGYFMPWGSGTVSILCSYIHFYVVAFKELFLHTVEDEYFINKYISSISGTLTGTAWSDGNKKYFTLSRSLCLERLSSDVVYFYTQDIILEGYCQYSNPHRQEYLWKISFG